MKNISNRLARVTHKTFRKSFVTTQVLEISKPPHQAAPPEWVKV